MNEEVEYSTLDEIWEKAKHLDSMAKFYTFRTRNTRHGGIGESVVRASTPEEAFKKVVKSWKKYKLYEPIEDKPIKVQ